MTLTEEGLLAMRGCWRFLRRDPDALEDFNLTAEGFWRSFAMVVPLLVLAYPMFVLEHRFDVEFAAESGQSPPELRLGVSYLSLLSGVVVWPLVAAVLARFFAVTQNYVRYMIIYNWMTLPAMILVVIPLLVYLATGASSLAQILAPAVFLFLLYVTWYVAKAGLETKVPVAFAFLLADLALAYGLHSVIR